MCEDWGWRIEMTQEGEVLSLLGVSLEHARKRLEAPQVRVNRDRTLTVRLDAPHEPQARYDAEVARRRWVAEAEAKRVARERKPI